MSKSLGGLMLYKEYSRKPTRDMSVSGWVVQVHPAYSMVNSGQVSSYRVPTLCN